MPGPSLPIASPRNGPSMAGLVQLAVEAEADERWVNGFSFDSETCGDGQTLSVICSYVGAGEGGADVDKTTADNEGVTSVTPILVVGSDRCSTLDRAREREALDRARRHVDAVLSHQLEAVLWTGEAEGDETPEGGDRPHLADGTATVLTSGTGIDPVAGLALLDQALTACLHGQQGMIHITPLLLVYLAHANAVRYAEDRWLSPNGHVVVAGSGYPGTGPRPGDPPGALPAAPNLLAIPPVDQFAYASPMVHVLVGDDDALTDVDREVNTRTVRVERPAAAFYAPCCTFAAEILPPPIDIT